jgi:S1-C subfamily serine protease
MTTPFLSPLGGVGQLAMAKAIRFIVSVTFAATFALVGPAIAVAENWILTSVSGSGDRYYVDADSLVSEGKTVRSWQAVELAKPQRTSSRKPYTKAIYLRSDDCETGRFYFIEYIYRDSSGIVVDSSQMPSEIINIVPGSIGSSYQKHVCALLNEPEGAPILSDISEGEWKELGPSDDNSFVMYIRMDNIIGLEGNAIGVHVRSDYTKPALINDIFINYQTGLYVIKCSSKEIASFGTDGYIGSKRVLTQRTPDSEFKFASINSGSFASTTASLGCNAPRTAKVPEKKAGPENIGFGTAWGVEKGYLVTASHVVEGDGRISVYLGGEKIGTATRVVNDKVNDIAILKMSNNYKISALQTSDKVARLGQSVFTLGFPVPGVLGQRIKMTAGEISSTSGMQDDIRQIQISVPIQQGNSGGPIIGWDGKVVGVVHAKLSRFGENGSDLNPENVNYAVKTAYIRPLLADLDDLGNYSLLRLSGGVDDIVDGARKAVFMLVVEQE